MSVPCFNEIHARRAADINDPKGRHVLVIGCNTGEDCKYFIDFGANEVHGVDVIANTGANFSHAMVHYHISSVENLALPDNYFHLTYCFATMEHVQDIESAFKEMARVTALGGYIYCLAAPLWNSPLGHHKGKFFSDFPWIHLRLTVDEIVELCVKNNISDPMGIDMRSHIEYMLDREYFNMVPSTFYVKVCSQLPEMINLANHIDYYSSKTLTDDIYSELEEKGYTRKELLASSHTYIAKKKGDDKFILAGLLNLIHACYKAFIICLRGRVSRVWRVI